MTDEPEWPEAAKSRKVSPTQRARAHCKANGWVSQIVEYTVPHTFIKRDLLGVIDMIVLDGAGGGPLGVQVCVGASHAARREKALAEPRLRNWLASPARFQIWSFSKRGGAGKRKLWDLRVEVIDLLMLDLSVT